MPPHAVFSVMQQCQDWSKDANDCKDCVSPVLSVIDITGEGGGRFSKTFVVNVDKFFVQDNGKSSRMQCALGFTVNKLAKHP